MSAITIIAARELRSMFLSPLAWSLLAVVFAILAYVLLVQIEHYTEWLPQLSKLETQPGLTVMVVTPMYRTGAFVMLCLMPLLCMRLVSEEKRNQTLELLLSSPVSMAEIILGKYLSLAIYLLSIVALIALLTGLLCFGGRLDLGLVAAGLLGLMLFMMSIAAIGLFISTLTRNPVIAGLGAFGLSMLLWILDWAGNQQDMTQGLFAYSAITPHLDNLLSGVVDTRDLAYFAIVIASFLMLSVQRMHAQSHT